MGTIKVGKKQKIEESNMNARACDRQDFKKPVKR